MPTRLEREGAPTDLALSLATDFDNTGHEFTDHFPWVNTDSCSAHRVVARGRWHSFFASATMQSVYRFETRFALYLETFAEELPVALRRCT